MKKNVREIDSKRLWKKVISESYSLEILHKKSKMWEKWHNLHNFGRKEIVDEMMNIHVNDILLDLGCGDSGLLSRFENKCKLTIGLDINEDFLAKFRYFFSGYGKLGCKKWGKLSIFRNISDYLIIEFIKMDQ